MTFNPVEGQDLYTYYAVVLFVCYVRLLIKDDDDYVATTALFALTTLLATSWEFFYVAFAMFIAFGFVKSVVASLFN